MIRYALTIFLSAFLLFQVQPIIGKFILPWFGGSPAVWTSCMLFFQVVLLAGYSYAHLIASRLTPRVKTACHVGLLLASLAFLPIAPSESWKPTDAELPVAPFWRYWRLRSACRIFCSPRPGRCCKRASSVAPAARPIDCMRCRTSGRC